MTLAQPYIDVGHAPEQKKVLIKKITAAMEDALGPLK